VFHHQELLPHNVEPGNHTIASPSDGANTDVDLYIGEGTMTQVMMILHLRPKL